MPEVLCPDAPLPGQGDRPLSIDSQPLIQRDCNVSWMERQVLPAFDMVRLTVALHAASGRSAQELFDTLKFLMASTRLEEGCQECHAWMDPDFTVHYLERWASEEDIRRRVRSTNFTSLLSVMEHAREAPQIEFDFVTTTRGLDFVAEVRGQPLK